MNLLTELENIYKNTGKLHHAYFVVGDTQQGHTELVTFLVNILGIQATGNPDVSFFEFDTFSIGDSRLLGLSQERKSFDGGKKIFIIRANSVTEEAQNALLKVFEEPTEGTLFFILSPQDILLPTLRSRVQIINIKQQNSQTAEKTTFLKTGVGERIALVKEIADGISDDEKTKQDAISLLNTIEEELYRDGLLKNARALSLCEAARSSLYDRGAPVKMILENLLLSI